MYKWRLCPLLLLFCTHIGSSKRFTRLSSGISHCFLYFKKQNKQSCWEWLLLDSGGERESRSAASLPLSGSLPPWNSLSHLRRQFSTMQILVVIISSHVQQQRLDSSVLWALPSPVPCTPHSSSGFAILFSAASCTKLCCDCAVGLDLAKRTQRSPFSSYQTTL